MTICVFYVANTNVIEVTGLKSAVEDTFIDDAIVTLTVKDADGNAVSGQTWPLALGYVDDSDGVYRGIIEDDVAFVAGTTYYAHINANAGANRKGHWEASFAAKTRRGV